jgi:membrane-associated PAP2 superfamily phosphatase
MPTLPFPTARPPLAPALARGWLLLALLTLAWDASGLDLSAMRLAGTPSGFPWQHHALLENVLHDGGRRLAWFAFGLLVLWAGLPVRADPRASPARRERLTVLALVTLSLLAVNLIKYTSRTSCPWEWSAFGGQATPVSHWNLWVGDGGRGRCFPGGHASGALAFLALGLPWLWPPVGGRRSGPGTAWLGVVLLAGTTAGLTQTLRGAHPPSHTLWTALICGAVALAGWWLALPMLRPAGSRP